MRRRRRDLGFMPAAAIRASASRLARRATPAPVRQPGFSLASVRPYIPWILGAVAVGIFILPRGRR